MKIRYALSYPLFMDKGGGVTQAFEGLNWLKKLGHQVEPLDWYSENIDFDVLFLFGFTHFNPEVLAFLKSKGVIIISEPIFVRVRSYLYYKVSRFLSNFTRTVYKNQYENLHLCDALFPNSNIEKNDIIRLYNVREDEIFVAYLGIPSYVFEEGDKISRDLFYNEYKITDFVFCPSARISVRKNQITLVKALKSTGIKLVLTGCNDIDEKIKDEFLELIKGDPNIICLPLLDKKMLISAYKNARVVVFPSLAETAGIVAIEGGYLGCRLVLSDIPIFREYFLDYSIYVNNKDPEDMRKKVLKALNEDYDPSAFREFLLKNRSWEAHAKIVNSVLEKLYESRK